MKVTLQDISQSLLLGIFLLIALSIGSFLSFLTERLNDSEMAAPASYPVYFKESVASARRCSNELYTKFAC